MSHMILSAHQWWVPYEWFVSSNYIKKQKVLNILRTYIKSILLIKSYI